MRTVGLVPLADLVTNLAVAGPHLDKLPLRWEGRVVGYVLIQENGPDFLLGLHLFGQDGQRMRFDVERQSWRGVKTPGYSTQSGWIRLSREDWGALSRSNTNLLIFNDHEMS